MSITSSEIKSRAAQISRRETTEISDAMVIEALIDVSKDSWALKSSTTGTLATDTNTITAPTDIIEPDDNGSIESFYLDDYQYDPITFKEWREGKLEGYALRDGTIYVSPKTQSARSYTIYYYKQHASDVDTIEFDDEYKMAIIYKVIEKLYENFELFDASDRFRGKYQAEIERLSSAIGFTSIRK